MPGLLQIKDKILSGDYTHEDFKTFLSEIVKATVIMPTKGNKPLYQAIDDVTYYIPIYSDESLLPNIYLKGGYELSELGYKELEGLLKGHEDENLEGYILDLNHNEIVIDKSLLKVIELGILADQY